MKFLKLLFSLMLSLGGLLFFFFSWIVFVDEISPAMKGGSLSVQTSSMILNHVWVGNEIYILLVIYVVIAVSLFGAGIVFARSTLRKS